MKLLLKCTAQIGMVIEKVFDYFFTTLIGFVFVLAPGICIPFILIEESFPGSLMVVFVMALFMAFGLSVIFPEKIGKKVKNVIRNTCASFLEILKKMRVKAQPVVIKAAATIRKNIPEPLIKIKSAIGKEAEYNDMFFESAWYIRYPLGLLCVGVAVVLGQFASAQDEWVLEASIWLWVVIIGVCAIRYMPGLTLTILAIAGLGLAYIFLQEFSHKLEDMPVSTAVIIGALIVAWAVSVQKK